MIGRAKAQVFAGCEDFGIALAEAQARGTPLIAFARGGSKDIVRPLGECDRPTGVLFRRQSVESIIQAVELFEKSDGAITPEACRENAMRFSVDNFREGILRAFARMMQEYDANMAIAKGDDEA